MTWIDIEIIINKNQLGLPMKTNSYSTIYEKLGITPVINAWGVATELGGWTLSPKVSKEMEDAKNLFQKYKWPSIDVTRKSVEETAASVLKIHDIFNQK